MFALSRMVIRAGVLAALIATVFSVASATAVQGEWESIEAHAETAFDWLTDLLGRLGDFDPSVGDITLADLASPGGWIDLGAGLFGGGEQPAEVDPVGGATDIARLVDVSVEDLTLGELAELRELGIDLDGLSLDDLSLDGLSLDVPDVPGIGND